jgi:acetyl esterase/lipase
MTVELGNRLQSVLGAGVNISASTILEHPTIQGLAEYLDKNETSTLGAEKPPEKAAIASLDPLDYQLAVGQFFAHESLALDRGASEVNIRTYRGLRYGTDKAQEIDLFVPVRDDGAPVPLVVLFHGGAGFSGHHSMEHLRCLRFTEAGLAAASIGYRLMPGVDLEIQAADALAGFEWLLAHKDLPIDRTRIGLYGHSTGAQLASLTALQSESKQPGQVKALIAASTPADLASMRMDFWPGRTMVEQGWTQQMEVVSPINHVTRHCPATLLIHGTADEVVPVEQSDRFAETLRSADCDLTYLRIDEGDHSVIRKEIPITEAIEAFLVRHLAPRPVASSDAARVAGKWLDGG